MTRHEITLNREGVNDILHLINIELNWIRAIGSGSPDNNKKIDKYKSLQQIFRGAKSVTVNHEVETEKGEQ